MSKVYGYCRTALTEGNNMEMQRAAVEDYCKSEGMLLNECFCDDSVSAHNMNREGLNKLFDVLKDGDVIVAKDASRFARDLRKHKQITDKIYDTGAKIIYINAVIEKEDVSALEDWFRTKLS